MEYYSLVGREEAGNEASWILLLSSAIDLSVAFGKSLLALELI